MAEWKSIFRPQVTEYLQAKDGPTGFTWFKFNADQNCLKVAGGYWLRELDSVLTDELKDGDWHQLSVTSDGLYVDGVRVQLCLT